MRYFARMAMAHTNDNRSAALMQRAALAAVAVAAGLAVLKAIAWWWTDSVAMLASFTDSALDLLASGVNALAIRHALTPADREHRFGHGKAEAVAGLGQAVLIGASALFLAWQSVVHILAPEPLAAGALGLAVMAVSIAATLALTRYQGHVARASGSLAVAADRLHYAGDVAANVAVVLALGLSLWLGWLWADGAFGLVIAATLAWSAWSIVGQSFDQLIDRELPEDDRARIKRIAGAEPGVHGVHDLRTRASGGNIFIQVHLEMDADLPLAAAHDISDRVEDALLTAFPNADIMIHEDPAGVVEQRKPLAFVRA